VSYRERMKMKKEEGNSNSNKIDLNRKIDLEKRVITFFFHQLSKNAR
jgi:hypothetical protein